MMKDVVSVALVVLIVFQYYFSGHGVAKKLQPDGMQEYAEAHNEARAEVGVGPLQWSQQLAHEASLWVRYQTKNNGCDFARRRGGWKYGVNQHLEGLRGTLMTPPRAVVDSWVEEKKYYNHSANSCAPNHQCGSYTQVVWRKSLELGCAMTICLEFPSTLTLCFYNPPGNYEGQSPY